MPLKPPNSDFAREKDMTQRAIQFRKEQGIPYPEQHAKELMDLTLLLRGKRIGFSMAECKELIELYDPASGNRALLETFTAKIATRRKQLAQQLRDIEQIQVELNRVATALPFGDV